MKSWTSCNGALVHGEQNAADFKRGLTIIGVDPGSRNTGWGVVNESSGVLRLVDCGVIRPSPRDPFATRLAHIFRELHAVLVRLKPDEAAVELVFTARNAATALKLGQARGAAVAACAARELPVSDYEPSVIKKAVVGVGSADKEQVSFMVGRMLGVRPDWALDTGDALAIAICHINTRRFEQRARLACPLRRPARQPIEGGVSWIKGENVMSTTNEQLGPFPRGGANTAYAQYFVGKSYLNMLTTEGLPIGNVTFEPGCRNNWHIHHAARGGGQILLCTAGRGWYQEWGKPARQLQAGDVVVIPAGMRHWHGAAKDSWFVHLAIEVPGEQARTEWLEPVDDAAYAQLP